MIREFYPDSYDVPAKMQSKLFASISPILELTRQQQFVSAAEVMTLVTDKIINSESRCLFDSPPGKHVENSGNLTLVREIRKSPGNCGLPVVC